jgi:hypothetical protein
MAGTSPAMTNETHCLSAVMPGFMPGIHVLTALQHHPRLCGSLTIR